MHIKIMALLFCVVMVWSALLHGFDLFEHYPLLKERLPHMVLGDLPTPVSKLEKLGTLFAHANIYMKRDDLTGAVVRGQRLFGGNKVRKLELLFADALCSRAHAIVTVGCAGSNHALASAVYAQQLGLKSYLILTPQINSAIVQRNLLLDVRSGAHIIPVQNRAQRIERYQALKRELGDDLYAIPVGGSVPLGCVGYVNAVFELKKQITHGMLPEPDVIYVACGSGGTAAGLLLGIKAAGLRTKLCAVAVDNDNHREILKKLVLETNALLHETDPSFPLFAWCDDEFAVNIDFIGGGYGVISAQAQQAMAMMQQYEQCALEGTYTAKACAALLHDLAHGSLKNKKVLFWNTFSAGDFAQEAQAVDKKLLPAKMQEYFA